MMVAVKQGVPKALGMTSQEWANKYLGGYIRMEASQRRDTVRDDEEENFDAKASEAKKA
jgi:hypothetical protein